MFDNDGMNNSSWLWFIIILFLVGGNGMFGNSGNNGTVIGQKAATTDEVYNATTQQSFANKLNDIMSAITTSQYDNAALINSNSNAINMTLNNGFNGITQQISNLGYQMNQCCCDLKSQMLQDKYDDVRNQLNLAQIASANAVQTDNILGQLGRFYTNPPYPYYNYGTTIA